MDRDEGDDDGDDAGRSIAYPSRTVWGQRWELSKGREWLSEPMRVMGIAVTPPFYGLMGMTLAQVELMARDQPVVVYPKTDKVKMGDKERTFTRPTRDELSEANDWWAERMRNQKNENNGNT